MLSVVASSGFEAERHCALMSPLHNYDGDVGDYIAGRNVPTRPSNLRRVLGTG